MPKLVVLSQGLAGKTHELKGEKVTVGRVEDNTFLIAEPSVSSHHCEIEMRGEEVFVKDLESTNGTFIDGNKITESVLKQGQVLRLGQIEMRLEGDQSQAAAPSRGTGASTLSRGVSLNELEQGPRAGSFDTASRGFSKKTNKVNRYFIIGGVIVGVVIVVLLVFVFLSI